MDITETGIKGKHVHSLEKNHVYPTNKNNLHMNDMHIDTWNPIYETLQQIVTPKSQLHVTPHKKISTTTICHSANTTCKYIFIQYNILFQVRRVPNINIYHYTFQLSNVRWKPKQNRNIVPTSILINTSFSMKDMFRLVFDTCDALMIAIYIYLLVMYVCNVYLV
jgi:hypothetical protein